MIFLLQYLCLIYCLLMCFIWIHHVLDYMGFNLIFQPWRFLDIDAFFVWRDYSKYKPSPKWKFLKKHSSQSLNPLLLGLFFSLFITHRWSIHHQFDNKNTYFTWILEETNYTVDLLQPPFLSHDLKQATQAWFDQFCFVNFSCQWLYFVSLLQWFIVISAMLCRLHF